MSYKTSLAVDNQLTRQGFLCVLSTICSTEFDQPLSLPQESLAHARLPLCVKMANELQLTVPAKIHECATQVYRDTGIQSTKPEQLEIVAGIVKGNVFTVLPTGYGMLSVFTGAL